MQAPIRTAICSFGMSGRVFHAPFLHVHDGFELYGVFERSTRKAHELYPSIKSFSSLQEMLDDESIELIIVNTPNATHYDYTKQALLAGKHVVVEKPFVINASQGQELAALADKVGKKISVFHNRRYDSDFLTVKQVVNEQLVGDIVEAEFHFDRYKEELSPKAHKETPGPGSGIVYDLCSHILDQALSLFGMPDAVFADIDIMRPISKVDDYFEILLYYPRKRVRLKGGYVVKHPAPSYIVHGTKGSFLKERGDVQEHDLDAGLYTSQNTWGTEPEALRGLLHANIDGKDILENIETRQGNYMMYYQQLFDAIRNDSEVPVSAIDGTNVIRIIEAAFESSSNGCKVAIPS
jgi:scyllo-inositol 2-dehydrogenase (NADP+)